MNNSFDILIEELKQAIKSSYEEGTSLDEAEKLAAKFLYGQMEVSKRLAEADLDSRMKKSGLKAIKAAVYMQEAAKGDKKPSDTYLNNAVDRDELVVGEQQNFDVAEVYRDELQTIFTILKEGHIYFRGIAKGRFE